MSLLPHSEDGQKKEESTQLDYLEERDYIPLQTLSPFSRLPSTNLKKRKFVMQESAVNTKEERDLERQIQDLQFKFPDHEIISDVGSGLNYKRKNFQILLDRVYDGPIQEVVVLHKERLCRYGLELVEFIFKKTGTSNSIFY